MPRHDAAPICPSLHRDDRPRRAADGLRVCRSCRDRMEQAIAETPALWDDLEAALVRAEAPTNSKITHRRDPGLAINENAIWARQALRWELHTTVRLVMEERGLSRWPADQVPNMVTWLLAHVDWLAAHEAAPDVVAGWLRVHSAATWAAHPSGTKSIVVDQCPECPGTLTALIRAQDSKLPSVVVCSANKEHEWHPHEWRALGRRLGRELGGLSA